MFEQFLPYLYTMVGFLMILLFFLIWQYLKLKKRLDLFLKTGDKDFGEILADLIRDFREEEKILEKTIKRVEGLEKIAKVSFQKAGIIRYNPFKEVGGDQSFSLALLDSQNSGLVITSLYLKEYNRIYIKPIVKEKSEYSLSEEEEKAIKQAITGKS